MTIQNKKAILYTGVFFDRESLYHLVTEKFGKGRLHQLVPYPHVTFQYMPQKIKDELLGEKVELKIVGYGNNGLNEGISVEWVSGSSMVKQLFDEIQTPHITLSYEKSGYPVNTRYLDFEPITPINISGVFGGFTQAGLCKSVSKMIS